MFGGREDFVEIDWYAEGDEEEASYTRAHPVWGLEGRWCYELGPE